MEKPSAQASQTKSSALSMARFCLFDDGCSDAGCSDAGSDCGGNRRFSCGSVVVTAQVAIEGQAVAVAQGLMSGALRCAKRLAYMTCIHVS